MWAKAPKSEHRARHEIVVASDDMDWKTLAGFGGQPQVHGHWVSVGPEGVELEAEIIEPGADDRIWIRERHKITYGQQKVMTGEPRPGEKIRIEFRITPE